MKLKLPPFIEDRSIKEINLIRCVCVCLCEQVNKSYDMIYTLIPVEILPVQKSLRYVTEDTTALVYWNQLSIDTFGWLYR